MTTAIHQLGSGSELSALQTIKRGLSISPEFRAGLGGTLALAVAATTGRMIVPITVQQIIDNGLRAPGGPDLGLTRFAVAAAAVAVLVTAGCGYLMNVRLYRSTEAGLRTLRVRAFRHVHDLSVLHQASERRGALVSRVTSDVDTISTFMQSAGILVLISAGQLALATVIMAVYSWQLTLLIWAIFLPLFVALRFVQRRLAVAYATVRERVGRMLAAISESVVGATVVRAYAIEDRSQVRLDGAIGAHYRSAVRAQRLVALSFSSGELAGGLATALVVVVGVRLGVDQQISAGELIAFLFLIALFVTPVAVGTEVLNEAQNAVAGWRRVIGVLDTEADVADPGEDGVVLPRGPIEVRFDRVDYHYPGGPPVLRDVSLRIPPGARVAVVGETGSGKTTFAKLLTRLMDPVAGEVLVDEVDLRRIRFGSLRDRIVMVPQDGYLFDTSVADNIRYGRPGATDAEVELALTELGLSDWLAGLSAGLDTPVGQRGEGLSAGERQLVALARAYLADPDLLVLDEATSAVDPVTEVRLSKALEGITRGRTAISIAHRMSTAQAADDVIVFDAGRVVERGHHTDLVGAGGTYARLYASWSRNTSSGRS
ncbi:MAG: ABC transporter ATP-binding protein/permease [Sporichthyaceae bacterium]|nr:ABC transporter ATP-binding protein/permease [Sporichthyaceae bacterium]